MKRDKKCYLSTEAPAMPLSGAEESSKCPPSNAKEKTAKALRILCPLPSHDTEDPVVMYNKYGILDQEVDESHLSDT